MRNEMAIKSQQAINEFNNHYETVEKLLSEGDLSKLSSKERTNYYLKQCESLGLNPLTRPFDYIKFATGKISLYAKKDCTEQLRKINGVSIEKIETKLVNDIYIVTAYASSNGRTDVATGAVNVKGISGDALANAYMKAETKAKRRVTLSICGLGILDESEIETIPNVKRVTEEDIKSTSERVLSKITDETISQVKELATEEQIKNFKSLVTILEVSDDALNKWLLKEGVTRFDDMKKETIQKYLTRMEEKIKESEPQEVA